MPMMRKLGMVLAIAGTLAFIYYVLQSVDFSELEDHLTALGLAALAAATVLYSLVVPLAAYAWQILLRAMGHRETLLRLNGILLATQAGKYLPGNFGQHLGRFGLSISMAIPPAILSVTMAYELALLLIADALTAAAAAAVAGLGKEIMGYGPTLVVVALVAGGGLLAIGTVAQFLPRIVRRWVPRAAGATELPTLGFGTIAKVIGIYVVAMLCVGASLSVLAIGLTPNAPSNFALLTAAFTVAWAVGFVTPGAPAGIGVREALLLLLLSPHLGVADASLLTLALRICTTVGDLLCLGIGVGLLHCVRDVGRGFSDRST